MAKEILYVTALDENDNLIHLKDAEKGKAYYCPECKGEMFLRRSGKTGKGSKRPHFYHNNLTSNCTGESVLHYSFKKLLIRLLERHIKEKKTLDVYWNCNTCAEKFKVNLLEKAISIREELNLKICQPDIALLDAEQNVMAVVEIVVTHDPEENTLQYYKVNNIVLIQVNLSSEEDLNNIEGKITFPDIVDYCLNPNCMEYSTDTINRRILQHPSYCGRCHSTIETFSIEVDSSLGKFRSLEFTDDEINLVKSKRRFIKVINDKPKRKKYPITDCRRCRMKSSRRNRRF